jgi:hypothetical protein
MHTWVSQQMTRIDDDENPQPCWQRRPTRTHPGETTLG